MRDKRVFVDTNILVYAHDKDAGAKRHAASRCVADLWNRSAPPSVSIQVLQELYVNLIRKKVAPATAREVVCDYLQWNVVPNDSPLLLEAIQLSQRWGVSFWDAAIIAAARRAGADVLWSEDLNEGQDYDGVKVVNPLK